MNKCKGCLKPIIMMANQKLCSDCQGKINLLPGPIQSMALMGLVALRETEDRLPIDAFLDDMREAHQEFERNCSGLNQ